MPTSHEHPADGHMTPDQFRELGHRLVDWVASYMEQPDRWPVQSAAQPGDVLRQLPDDPPQEPGAPDEWDAIVRDLDDIILPGLTHWQSPGFLGYFPCQASGPAILGELVSAGLNVNGMSWATSPAATELEMRVTDWMAGAIGLPESFMFGRAGFASPGGGCIQGTASEATLIALLAGRSRVLHRPGRTVAPDRLVVYASTQAHSSVLKAAMIAGLARDADDTSRVRFVATDADLAMDPGALADAMTDDLAAGRHPCCVVATVGTTSSGAFDPIAKIAGALEDVGVTDDCWLHVDAAHAGAACICPEHRWILDGVGRADSIVFNPHKALLTNFDCSLLWTRDRASLTRALSVSPEYLRTPATGPGRTIDYRDWQIPLGRRFRALKLWFVMRHYGVEGLRAFVRGQIRMAVLFESLVRADQRFEICAPRHLQLVCFRMTGPPGIDPELLNARNRELLERINLTGRVFLSHTTLPSPDGGPERFVLRLAVGSTSCRDEHIRTAWDIVRREADST